MKHSILIRLLAVACLAATSGIVAAQGTTPGTSPTNPAPETMGTPMSGPGPGAETPTLNSAKSGPTMADCKKMMADHQKNPSMKMNDDDKAKMKACHDMKSNNSMSSTDSSKMN